MAYYLTNHAEERMQQRGVRERDVDVVLLHGTQTGQAVVLTCKDAEAAIAEHKRQIAQLQRLKGLAAFTRDCAVVTLFRPTPEQLRKLMHGVRSIRRVRRERRAGRRRGGRRSHGHAGENHPRGGRR